MTINVNSLREQFPALLQQVNDRPVVYLDGPGGTQVSQRVIDAMATALSVGISNQGGLFLTSERTDAIVAEARGAMVDFYNASRPEEIIFGQNMTSLTFSLSRALSREWQAGDEIILTRLDHDANIAPWLLAAEEKGVVVRWLDFRPEDCTLKLEDLAGLLNRRTRLLAITHASNAVGTLPDVGHAVQLAHAARALVYVDAVHYGPHGLIDVQALDCDFLVTSAYKYFGPHIGVLYGKYELLDRLRAYKVRPAPGKPAGKWETGTQSFESLAGLTAAVNYLAEVDGRGKTRREGLAQGMAGIKQHEMALGERFLRGAVQVPGLRVYGITDIERLEQRAPTFAVSLQGYTAAEVAGRLGEEGIFVWHGHYYAVAVMERLGLLEKGGLVRIGFVHINSPAEVERVLIALSHLSSKKQNSSTTKVV